MNKFLLEFIDNNFKDPADTLDLGCGKNREVNYLRNNDWNVTGVDLPEVDLNLPYNSKHKFDLVYSLFVLQFIKNKDVFVNTCYNNLKTGGKLFVSTFHKDDNNFKIELFAEEELKGLFKDKFKDVKVERFDIEEDHSPIGKHKHAILIVTTVKV